MLNKTVFEWDGGCLHCIDQMAQARAVTQPLVVVYLFRQVSFYLGVYLPGWVSWLVQDPIEPHRGYHRLVAVGDRLQEEEKGDEQRVKKRRNVKRVQQKKIIAVIQKEIW